MPKQLDSMTIEDIKQALDHLSHAKMAITEEPMQIEIEALRQALPCLEAGDQTFANSLLKQATGRGLSDKQMFWVKKLTARATEPATAPVEIANVMGIVALLDRAAGHLKYPKVLVRVGDLTLRLSIAGDRSKAPGSINVAGTGDREWYGRITRAGCYEPSRNANIETASDIGGALRALALDPAGIAAKYGKLTGACCFCGIALSDERSTRVGYGPTCADNYGLPWGQTD